MARVGLRRRVADPLTLLAIIAAGATASALFLERRGEPAVLLTVAAVVAAVALSGST